MRRAQFIFAFHEEIKCILRGRKLCIIKCCSNTPREACERTHTRLMMLPDNTNPLSSPQKRTIMDLEQEKKED